MFNFKSPVRKTAVAAKAKPKQADVPFVGFVSLRPEMRGDKATGNATRGLHRFGVDIDGAKQEFDTEFYTNFQTFLEAEAKRMGGTLTDRGCVMMIPYIVPLQARANAAAGNYTVPTIGICTELHNLVQEELGLRPLGRQTVGAVANSEDEGEKLISGEDVPF